MFRISEAMRGDLFKHSLIKRPLKHLELKNHGGNSGNIQKHMKSINAHNFTINIDKFQ